MDLQISGKTALVTGAIAVGSTPAEFTEFIRAEQVRWSEVIRKAGVKVE